MTPSADYPITCAAFWNDPETGVESAPDSCDCHDNSYRNAQLCVLFECVCVCMCAHGCVSVWQCTCMHVCVHVCVVVCVLAGACPGNVLHCDLWPGLVGDVGG